MKYLDLFLSRVMRFLASAYCFWVIVGLLVVQAIWIALSSHYPMAFDEDFHLGIIRIYAHHWSPFLASQPAHADMYGAVARDPSYLYHYLLSFPYRLISALTSNQTAQVLALRALNIVLAVGGLVVYRRLLALTGASRAVINGCLLFFIFIPVVPLLAAQINYDNLFIPVIGIALLLTARVSQRLRNGQFDVIGLLWLLICCLLACLIKYAFLPVLMGIGLYLLLVLIKSWRASHTTFWKMLVDARHQVSQTYLIGLTVLAVLAIGLFSQRYIVNIVRYHTPIPDCGKVLSLKQCRAYGPWIRDYDFAINKIDEAHNPLVYIGDWFYGMWLRLYFAVDGPASQFQTRGPLPIPGISAIVIAIGGIVACLISFTWLKRQSYAPVLALFLTTGLVYVCTLFIDNYRAYLRTGQPVAINGRYLLPFTLMALLVAAVASRHLLRNHPRISGALVVIVLLSQIWGGGALTYILRSNDSWYISNSAVKSANHAVQAVVGPLTPGYQQPTEFLH